MASSHGATLSASAFAGVPFRTWVARLQSILPAGAVPLVAFFAAILIAPVALLVLYSFFEPSFFAVIEVLTVQNYRLILTTSLYSTILLKTLGVSFVVACAIVVIGYAMAYAITFRLGKWGPRVLVLVMASLLSSYIVRLYALTTILGTNGLLNQALLSLGLIRQPLGFLLYGYFAIVITLVYVYLPIAVLPMYAGLQGIDRRLAEASRDLGEGPWHTFLRVTLPLSMRGIRTAFAFSFILSSADYVAPRMVGGLSGQMVGAVIADQFGGASNYPLGAALAVCMVIGFGLVLGAMLALEALVRAVLRRRPRARATLALRLPRLPPLPVSQAVTFAALAFLFCPLLTVIVFSFNGARNPGLPFRGVTLHWYGDLLRSPDFGRVLSTSLIIGACTVVVGLVIGVPAALALARRQFALRRSLEILALWPIAMPGVVIGVALLTSFVYIGIRLGVGTTIAAHTLLVTPFIVLVVRTRLEKMDRRIEEAGRDLGSSPGRVFRTVTLPILAPALLGAGILAAAVSLDELLVTSFTIGVHATVPVWIASQMRAGLTPALNAVAVLMLVGSLSLISLAALTSRMRRSSRLLEPLVEAK
jgi:ABC-type spermidine/putrescine transport system permease subunit II